MIDLLGSYFQDASITFSRFNPLTCKHESVCSSGYDQRMLDFLNGTFINQDEHMVFLRSSKLTYLEWNSLPARADPAGWQGGKLTYLEGDPLPEPYHETPAAKKYFIPRGYQGGATQLLFSSDCQYTGALHINTKSPDSINQEGRRLISHSAPVLASITNWWTEIGLPEHEDEHEGFLFVFSGQDVFCNRGEPDFILGKNTKNKIMKSIIENRIPIHFYIEDSHGKIWAMKSTKKGREFLLYAQPSTIPFAITPRELDVASWLVSGLQSKEIARALRISDRTVSHHIENLLRKLCMHSRSSAAIFCYQQGIVTLR